MSGGDCSLTSPDFPALEAAARPLITRQGRFLYTFGPIVQSPLPVSTWIAVRPSPRFAPPTLRPDLRRGAPAQLTTRLPLPRAEPVLNEAPGPALVTKS